MPPRLRAVLFDLDGTLLDTAPDMVGALNELRLQHSLPPLPYDEVRPSVSHGSSRLVKLGFPTAGPTEATHLQQRFLDIYAASVCRGTRLFPGMERALACLDANGLTLGIVTNKPARLTDALLQALGLSRRFTCVVSGDTLSERKPHPLPLLHAAALAAVDAAACVYVGDAERDIQAAHAAGMPALVATYGYLAPDEDWRAWGGDGSIAAPTELLTWLERSGRVGSEASPDRS